MEPQNDPKSVPKTTSKKTPKKSYFHKPELARNGKREHEKHVHTRASSFGTCLTRYGAFSNASEARFGSILVPYWLREAVVRPSVALGGPGRPWEALAGSGRPREALGSPETLWEALRSSGMLFWCHFGTIWGAILGSFWAHFRLLGPRAGYGHFGSPLFDF